MYVQDEESDIRRLSREQNRALGIKVKVGVRKVAVDSQNVETIQTEMELTLQLMWPLLSKSGENISQLLYLESANPP